MEKLEISKDLIINYFKIDIDKLKRNYEEYPIMRGSKHYPTQIDRPIKEDLVYLYIEKNLTKKVCLLFFNGLKGDKLDACLKFYNIKKSKEQIIESQQTLEKLRYNGLHPSQCDFVKEKLKQTNMERYGVQYYASTEESKIKHRITYTNNLEKRREKWGVDSHFQSEEFKKKRLEIYRKRWGCNHPMQTEEIKEKKKKNNLEKYGVEHTSKLLSTRNKLKQTCLERYGVTNYSQTQGFLEKLHKNIGETVEKRKRTCLAKYGYDSPSKNPKVKQIKASKMFEKLEKEYQTKKLHNSFNTSSPETRIYNLLLTKFPDTLTQYKSSLYPYSCDFYIPSLDVYIEYQGSWTHGNEPFDKNNLKHQEILSSWQEKSKELNFKGKPKLFYLNAINTWTDLDVRKRKIAKENNLNYLEFFNEKEFLEWFDKQ